MNGVWLLVFVGCVLIAWGGWALWAYAPSRWVQVPATVLESEPVITPSTAGLLETATAMTIHVYGGDEYPWAYEDGVRIKLVPEKKLHQPGDTARVLVLSPIEGTALVTVEREKVLRSFMVELKADKPGLEQSQRQGRSLLWDKAIDRSFQAEAETARARLTLDKTRAETAAARAALLAERADLDRAAASGDDAALRRGVLLDYLRHLFDVLRHRIILSYEAEAEEMTTDDIITEIFNNIEVP